ncbi:hypothetical protein BVRB_4g078540 [Beta vulgaris subsp. vulgaris]|nr:hypothetical protein BVRB_4g078540 [Beta vulgaris subsp. vulgaris]
MRCSRKPPQQSKSIANLAGIIVHSSVMIQLSEQSNFNHWHFLGQL